jgi:hypothetical protein
MDVEKLLTKDKADFLCARIAKGFGLERFSTLRTSEGFLSPPAPPRPVAPVAAQARV